jgi:hypothetical protein
MKSVTIIGIVLILLGILGFVVPRITFTQTETVVDVGPLEVQAERERSIPIPDIAAGAAVVAGIALVVAGTRR